MVKQKLPNLLIWRVFFPLLMYVATGFYAAQALEIKVATVAPEGSGWMNEMRAWRRTNHGANLRDGLLSSFIPVV